MRLIPVDGISGINRYKNPKMRPYVIAQKLARRRVKCSWCGDSRNVHAKGEIIAGYHDSCRKTKMRVKST